MFGFNFYLEHFFNIGKLIIKGMKMFEIARIWETIYAILINLPAGYVNVIAIWRGNRINPPDSLSANGTTTVDEPVFLSWDTRKPVLF